MIRVLVVDASPEQRAALTRILESDLDIKVISTATDGEEAIAKALQFKPDIITMDLHLRKIGGIEATRSIMELAPTPIVIMNSQGFMHETINLFEAMEAGALDLIDKIGATTNKKNEFIQSIKLMSEVKVVHRYPRLKKSLKNPALITNTSIHNITLITIGSSTGGPVVLQKIFKHLKKPFPPILVVQHISPSFLSGLVEWLQNTTNVHLKIAEQNEMLEKNCIYFAPDDYQMGISNTFRILLSDKAPENGHKPSVSYLFRSIAKVTAKNSLNIILTGMGSDGAKELKILRDNGAITIAQDKESSVIFGMPGEAIALNAAQHILNPNKISDFINSIYHE